MNFALQNTAIDPIHQFQVSKWLDLNIGGVDLSFTNASLFMVISAGAAAGFLYLATAKRGLIPSRTQSMKSPTGVGAGGRFCSRALSITCPSPATPLRSNTSNGTPVISAIASEPK